MSSSSSSEEDGGIITNSITNYHFLNHHKVPITFTDLPLHLTTTTTVTGDTSSAYLLGTTENSLQSVYIEVIGWKYDLSLDSPEVYVAKKSKNRDSECVRWIRLVKARSRYEVVVRSDLVFVKLLHYLKSCCEATRDEIASFLAKSCTSSSDVIESLKSYLADYVPLIRSAMENDKDLANSKYLETFLMEIDNPGETEIFHESFSCALKENQATKETKVIIYLNGCHCCEGQCIRSFHPTTDAGVDNYCESLGFENAAQYEAIPNFLCDNCKFQKHQCFACGMLGSSDKSTTAEVFPCVSATCGHFYHPECVAKLLYPSDETLAMKFKSQIAAGESFTCPAHKCHCCEQGEDKDVRDMQFAVCRRCPKSYHRKCLPKEIAFEDSDDGTIVQRAWDLPKRILIYCLKHTIIPSIETPRRDHLLFPCISRRRDQDGSKTEIISERRSKTYGNLKVSDTVKMPKVIERPHSTVNRGNFLVNDTVKMPNVIKKPNSTVTYGDKIPEKDKSSNMHEKVSSFEKNISNVRKPVQPSNMVPVKPPSKDMQSDQPLISKPVKKRVVSSPPRVDADMKARILNLMKDSTSSFDFEEFIREKKRRCTHQTGTPQTGLDKSITMGKVEASVKAVGRAWQILETGGSIEDAKAVCEPNVLNQLNRWKNKLRVFLAPFLHGTRYTSFGRHFTKVDKLREIVDRLHWYVQDGDVIVDFCCGSNDFSVFMKEKLDITGKKCLFRNYDLITPKNAFQFEKRDWLSVPVNTLPEGSRLVMGLNPPFGVNASLANKFIDHALTFKPKLLILIVPPETKRLDRKRSPYDLIWQEKSMLSGKSFYLPGSTDIQGQLIEDWNNKPPPLSLWSRPDWTTKHKAIAKERGHVKKTVAENCKALKKLYVGNLHKSEIGDEWLISVNLLVLIEVNASCVSLQVITTNCLILVRLELCRNDTIADVEMMCITENAFVVGCPDLVEIRVTECKKVTRKDRLRASRESLVIKLDHWFKMAYIVSSACHVFGTLSAMYRNTQFKTKTGSTSDSGVQEHVEEVPPAANDVAVTRPERVQLFCC
ncbi:zinc finger, RING/FYVE/PHD-type, Methyltransferase, trithorax [Artemisia annua]|uniref:Zinc finger, RING/FYVE/PHD-type, Methyltransferase, trithorax n=1 Tax=Artemisia annua TaxID=35608 RepID=A0A2U1MN16_ARTAN|nr:zinc finger, RING/FYVE/PHD-type, Methyltransferase, trithorax [Artemisia annua]